MTTTKNGSPATFGELVRERRLERGKTQKDLSRELGCTTSWVAHLEMGGFRRTPAPNLLHRLGDALGVSVTELLKASGYDVVGARS